MINRTDDHLENEVNKVDEEKKGNAMAFMDERDFAEERFNAQLLCDESELDDTYNMPIPEDATEEYSLEYILYCEEQEAIWRGTAIQLTECYLCPEGSPRRGILRHSVSGGSDPYDVQHLNCGHAII
jgi:hypothetical protein